MFDAARQSDVGQLAAQLGGRHQTLVQCTCEERPQGLPVGLLSNGRHIAARGFEEPLSALHIDKRFIGDVAGGERLIKGESGHIRLEELSGDNLVKHHACAGGTRQLVSRVLPPVFVRHGQGDARADGMGCLGRQGLARLFHQGAGRLHIRGDNSRNLRGHLRHSRARGGPFASCPLAPLASHRFHARREES